MVRLGQRFNMEYINGRVVRAENGIITIQAKYAHPERLFRCREVQIGITDERNASPAQIRKAHTLISAIAEYQGEHRIEAERELKSDFVAERLGMSVQATFSLKECDMTTASEFISFLVDRCVEYRIPLDRPVAELCDDINRYVYKCFMCKACAVCGSRAELHHVDRVGMGGDREHMSHIGLEALPLCRYHHAEAHRLGDGRFCEMNHIAPLRINGEIAKAYHLGGEDGQ